MGRRHAAARGRGRSWWRSWGCRVKNACSLTALRCNCKLACPCEVQDATHASCIASSARIIRIGAGCACCQSEAVVYTDGSITAYDAALKRLVRKANVGLRVATHVRISQHAPSYAKSIAHADDERATVDAQIPQLTSAAIEHERRDCRKIHQ